MKQTSNLSFSLSLSLYVCLYVHIHVYVYIYIYIYIRIYVYTTQANNTQQQHFEDAGFESKQGNEKKFGEVASQLQR